ncbi:Myb-like DNA-binding domain containing protein [Tritrichomonas foetus]|uniref:Myb-like DNA-binding domain containing protein n=1 Tax=Tritrichomonas foetus TaxID=1144522 RepID=A0A1J4L4I5_9EUKA|nr:Myb-like DNA-binding domain containing protein [Tritrichomonas foetus]|eukprot:OHT16854.1 Myb-like DNA-binding domain containing protein [Tritrichomonas foetus]
MSDLKKMMEKEKKQRRRMKFLPDEDDMLRKLVNEYGESSWVQISSQMKGRNVRQCRERWKHYLSATCSSKDPFTEEEDRILIEKYLQLGPKWTKIAKFLKGRSDIQVKARIMQKLASLGNVFMNLPHPPTNVMANNNHMIIKNNFLIHDMANSENSQIVQNKPLENVIEELPDMKFEDDFEIFNQPVSENNNDNQNAENLFWNDFI